MATRKTKLKISIKELSFEFEGTQEEAQVAQQGIQQALGSLMNAQSRVLTHRPDAPSVIDTVTVETATDQARPAAANGTAEKPKPPRQRRVRGPSLASLLLALKQEGYFSQARSSGEVLAYLKDSKGHTLRSSRVMTELQRMVQKEDGEPSKLYRNKSDSENYVYKDSPFNESPRGPGPSDQPAD
jgi:hypothetical protein